MPNDYVKFSCSSCGKRVGVPENLAGKQIKCPLCKGLTRVPAESEAKAVPSGNSENAKDDRETHIKYYCDKCNKRIAVPLDCANRTIKCPLCHQASHVPQSSQPRKDTLEGSDTVLADSSRADGAKSEVTPEKVVSGEQNTSEENAPRDENRAEAEAPETEAVAEEPVKQGHPPAPTPTTTYKKTTYTLDDLKKDSENIPKVEPPPEPEEPRKGINPLVAGGVIVGLAVLLLVVVNWKKVNYYLFHRANRRYIVTANRATVSKMQNIHAVIAASYAKTKLIPGSLDEILTLAETAPEGLKDAGGKWFFVYTPPTPEEMRNLERPRIMLYDTPEMRKDKIRHILFSNGNCLAVRQSEFKKHLEVYREAYENN